MPPPTRRPGHRSGHDDRDRELPRHRLARDGRRRCRTPPTRRSSTRRSTSRAPCSTSDGEMIGQGEFCPAQLGATTMALRWIIDEFGLDALGPGDVFLHNDPYSGMNHLPEHMVVKARVLRGRARRHRRLHRAHGRGRRHGARRLPRRRAGGLPGGTADPAGQDRQGRAFEDADLWRLILANNRTPRVSAGDLRAMIGSLQRRRAPAARARAPPWHRALPARSRTHIKDYSERRMRAAIGELPNGTYVAHEYIIDNDGWLDEPARVRVEMTVEDDRVMADFTGHRRRSGRGPATSRWSPPISAVYNAILHMTDPDIPSNAGRYRPIEVIAPPGTIVNATYPVATVGGNSEVHPHLVTLIWKAMADAVPDKVGAAGLGDRDAGDLRRRGPRHRRAVQQPDPRGAGLRAARSPATAGTSSPCRTRTAS